MKDTNPPSIQQFRQFVELRDYAPATKDEYVRYLRTTARHCGADPATLTEPQLREFFLHVRQSRRFGPVSLNGLKCALRLFYRDHLRVGTDWRVFEDLRIVRGQTLPAVLSREQVAALLGVVRAPRFRSRTWQTLRLSPQEFIRRWLQHVLPRGFVRVRHYGWLSPAAKGRWHQVLRLLLWEPPEPKPPRATPAPECPRCGKPMNLLGTFPRAP